MTKAYPTQWLIQRNEITELSATHQALFEKVSSFVST
jgi:hypothetical protein